MKELRYITHIKKERIFGYAIRVLLGDVGNLRIYNYIDNILIKEDAYQADSKGNLKFVCFKDFDYTSDDSHGEKECGLLEAYSYARFVYNNLPYDFKDGYAKEWNERFSEMAREEEFKAIGRNLYDYKLPSILDARFNKNI